MSLRVIVTSTLVFSVLFCGESFALDIESIDIHHSKDHYNGAPVNSTPWEFEIRVEGTEITSVSVTDPDGTVTDLEETGPNEWEFEHIGISSETEWLTDYPMGAYTFSFNGGADSVVVDHNEPIPGGFADITYPTLDANDIPYDNPVFTWADCEHLGEHLDLNVDGDFDESIFTANFPSDTNSVVVTGLFPARHYYFGLTLDNNSNQDRTTVGGDSFWYSSIISYFNEVEFQTKPIPGDFQVDGRVNALDIETLAQAWLATSVDATWNPVCDISETKDNTINIPDFAILSQHWQEVNGNIFDANSAFITNPLLGLTNVGDSYSLSGYGTEAGAQRSYSLIGTETVMGVDCVILKIFGYGEIPQSDYYDMRIAEDFAGNIRILKITGLDEDGPMAWQSDTVNFAPIFLPSMETLADDDENIYPLWADNYNEFIAFDQTVPLMSTGAGPYTGCVQYNWNSDDGEGGVDVDENYICPDYGYVKEVWDDGQAGGWERNPDFVSMSYIPDGTFQMGNHFEENILYELPRDGTRVTKVYRLKVDKNNTASGVSFETFIQLGKETI